MKELIMIVKICYIWPVMHNEEMLHMLLVVLIINVDSGGDCCVK